MRDYSVTVLGLYTGFVNTPSDRSRILFSLCTLNSYYIIPLQNITLLHRLLALLLFKISMYVFTSIKICSQMIVMYPKPNVITCIARFWLREIGFSLTYGALMLKTWR